jgi:hypothetical protein
MGGVKYWAGQRARRAAGGGRRAAVRRAAGRRAASSGRPGSRRRAAGRPAAGQPGGRFAAQTHWLLRLSKAQWAQQNSVLEDRGIFLRWPHLRALQVA